MIDRRGFLGVVPAALVAGHRMVRTEPERGSTLTQEADVVASPLIERWGVQLYTLRSLLADDVDGTLTAISDIGYREVELAGLWGLSPAEMRVRLDAVGLVAASSHHGMDAVRGEWQRTLDDALELGQSQVVVPSLSGGDRTAEGLRRVADDFNRAGEAATQVGLRFGYHNHDWELRPLDEGVRPMDLLLERTDPDLVDWQMDVFWTVHGGGDPMRYLDSYPGRFRSMHIKDRTPDGRMVDVGDGVIDFQRVLVRAENEGLSHAFVEHDNPGEALESVRRSFEHLSSFGGAP